MSDTSEWCGRDVIELDDPVYALVRRDGSMRAPDEGMHLRGLEAITAAGYRMGVFHSLGCADAARMAAASASN